MGRCKESLREEVTRAFRGSGSLDPLLAPTINRSPQTDCAKLRLSTVAHVLASIVALPPDACDGDQTHASDGHGQIWQFRRRRFPASYPDESDPMTLIVKDIDVGQVPILALGCQDR